MSLVAERVGALFGAAELAGGLSFHAVSARVRAKGGVLLGWQRAPGGHDDASARPGRRGSLTLNPAGKGSARRWRACDELVVIRRPAAGDVANNPHSHSLAFSAFNSLYSSINFKI
jgi:hypothetical protein